jgi:hypothetical protein
MCVCRKCGEYSIERCNRTFALKFYLWTLSYVLISVSVGYFHCPVVPALFCCGAGCFPTIAPNFALHVIFLKIARSYGTFSDIVDVHNTINDLPLPVFASAYFALPSLPILMVAWNVSPHESWVEEVTLQRQLHAALEFSI